MSASYLLGSAQPSFFSWLTSFHLTQLFGQNGETGVDVGTPFHTPITSLSYGTVTGTGYYGGGGVVSVLSQVNGQPAEVYYQHLDTVNVQKGQQVQPGTFLGLSGGQLSGGSHPSTTQFSNGPHVEVGIDAPYGGMWNPMHLGPNINPLNWLTGTVTGSINPPVSSGPISGSVNLPGGSPFSPQQWGQGFLQGITQGIGARSFPDLAWRTALIIGGMVLIVLGLLVFFSHQETSVVEQVTSQAKQAGKAAAAAA